MDDPTSIPELLDRTLAAKRMTERAASLYMGVAQNAVNTWRKRGRRPDPDSCRLIAKWAGYSEEFVLQLAGHLSGGPPGVSPPPLPEVEIIPEIGVLLRRYTPAEQRRYVLPMLDLVRVLREDSGDYDAPPPEPPPAAQPPPRPSRRRRGPQPPAQ